MPTETPEATVSAEAYSAELIDALVDAIRAATTPEMSDAQEILLRRLALSGDVIPSRLPPPVTNTQVGGYLNLLDSIDQPELRAQVIASMFGVAGPSPAVGWAPGKPVVYFVSRPNDRSGGTPEQQAAIPVQFSVRSDFAAPLEAALTEIHELGGELPLLSQPRVLPREDEAAPGDVEMLRHVGRTLEIVPSAALRDPDADTIALARKGASGLELVARQLDAGAVRAGEVAEESWTAWKCTAANCQETADDRTYISLTPILNEAGWFAAPPTAPTSLSDTGEWGRWTNITGLVAGSTTYGSELRLLYSDAEIAASLLRERLGWVWNGTAFAATS